MSGERKDRFALRFEPFEELAISAEQGDLIRAELERTGDAIAKILDIKVKQE
jgi:hypothetical protein